ncbi:hypothetical protein GOP47_0010202 [Adiantum capillus-veneris]|uniref:Uncharacterized protein n=1 Tax=Adiantum capillus-veneris TaxID=13818 RepID=A0A9D4UUC0_ADICA|nr:hypothetical protein GOP47_0010202 [Adiantum capillus-veneris]
MPINPLLLSFISPWLLPRQLLPPILFITFRQYLLSTAGSFVPQIFRLGCLLGFLGLAPPSSGVPVGFSHCLLISSAARILSNAHLATSIVCTRVEAGFFSSRSRRYGFRN